MLKNDINLKDRKTYDDIKYAIKLSGYNLSTMAKPSILKDRL